jgi:hypothetical protein
MGHLLTEMVSLKLAISRDREFLRSYAAEMQPLTGRCLASPKKQNHAETAVWTGLPCGSSSESPPETFTNFSARYSLVSFAYPTFRAQEHYRA